MADDRILPALMLIGGLLYFFADKLSLGSNVAQLGLFLFVGGVAIMLAPRLGLR